MRVLLLLLVAALAATPAAGQQPNGDPVKLLFISGVIFQSITYTFNTTLPGPHSVQIPTNGPYGNFVGLYLYGDTNQFGWLYTQQGPPTVGWLTLPGGIVDINANMMQLVSEGSVPPNGSGLACGGVIIYQTGLNLPPFSYTFQGAVTDPTSPAGYTLTAAIHVVAQ